MSKRRNQKDDGFGLFTGSDIHPGLTGAGVLFLCVIGLIFYAWPLVLIIGGIAIAVFLYKLFR